MALQKPNFNLLGRSALNVKRSKISASTFSSPLKMSKNISFMKSPGVGQKLTSGSLQSIFANQELLKAPSIPNAGEGILSSNLILTELSETNRILGEIQKQLAIDFTNRITEKEKNLSNMRKGIFGKRSKDEEDALEAKKKIDKDSSFLSKTFDAVTKPAKGIFERLKEFFALLLTGIVTSAAFEWLSNESNREKLTRFFNWVADHWIWIVGVIAGGVLIGGILNLLGALGGIKTLIDLIPRRIGGPGGGNCFPIANCGLEWVKVAALAFSPYLLQEIVKKWPFLKDGLVSDPKFKPANAIKPFKIPVELQPLAWLAAVIKAEKIKTLIDLGKFILGGLSPKVLAQKLENLENNLNLEDKKINIPDLKTIAEGALSSQFAQKLQNIDLKVEERTNGILNTLNSTVQTIWDSVSSIPGNIAEAWANRPEWVDPALALLGTVAGIVLLIKTGVISGPVAGVIGLLGLFGIGEGLKLQGAMADGGLVEKYAKGGKTKRKKKACCSNCAMGFSAGKMQDGGKLNGPSHEEGGIPIEVEGGEYIVNKSDTTKFLPILEDINYNSGEMWQHFVNATSILNTNLKDQLIINDKISKILTEFNDKLYDLSLAYATDTVMARASQVSDIPSLASSTSSFSGATASLTPVVTVIPKLLTVGKKQRVVRNMSLDIPGDSTTIDARSNKGEVSSESVAVKPMASTQGISMTPSPVDSYNVSRMAAVYSLYGIG